MKTLGLSVILSASCSLAFAAGLPSRSNAPVYIPPVPVFSWTGFYIGAAAGFTFDNRHDFNNAGNTATAAANLAAGYHPANISASMNGFTGGGETGYNYQFANTPFVIGIEADIQYAGPAAHSFYQFTSAGPVNNFTSQNDYLGTIRGRLGYAFNNILIYGTGGWAYGQVKDQWNIVRSDGLAAYNSQTAFRSGYAVGGGVAYALPSTSFLGGWVNSVILKAEYLYYNFGTYYMYSLGPVAPNSFSSQIAAKGNLIRFGVDFEFGGPQASLLAAAKY